MEVLIPFITAAIIDKGIEAGNLNEVYFYGILMLVIAFLSLACGALAGRYAAKASSGLACNLRDGMYEKVQGFAFSNIDKFSTAGLVTRMTTDVTNVQNAYQMILRIAVRAPLMLICSMRTAPMKSSMSRKQQMQSLRRVLGTMLKNYKFSFFLVVVCILGAALATLRGTLFLQNLIDDYITPLTQAQVPDYSGLAGALLSVAGIYAIGILCAYGYNRIMVNVSQGTMRNVRVELFRHMESLPIRYFDTHARGDIMSVYTNDVDTLRQLMSQSIPQVINSSVTIVTSFVSMMVPAQGKDSHSQQPAGPFSRQHV